MRQYRNPRTGIQSENSLPYIWDKEERKKAAQIYGTDEWYRRIKETNKSHARRSGIYFDITSAQIKELYHQHGSHCCYCKMSAKESMQKFGIRLTVDRKDSSGGYTKDNVCLACLRCNTIKGSCISYDQMKRIAHDIRSFCDQPEKFANFGHRNQT
jgi:hypothetical protein